MSSEEKLREILLRDYGTIAKMASEFGNEWWRKQVCMPIFGPIAAEYPQQIGYIEAADHALGCAFPVALSDIKENDTVLDLGCASGVDSFIAAQAVGEGGKVIGLDICPELIAKAEAIALANGIQNADFLVADLAAIPLPDQSADAMISNGVFSLLPDRHAVFAEMYRVLKPGGHFLIADLCCLQPISEEIHSALKQFTGCLNGIQHISAYAEAAQSSGFLDLKHRQLRPVLIPEEVWAKHASSHAEKALFEGNGPLVAAGLFGRKPL